MRSRGAMADGGTTAASIDSAPPAAMPGRSSAIRRQRLGHGGQEFGDPGPAQPCRRQKRKFRELLAAETRFRGNGL